jgi:hypothetical protein
MKSNASNETISVMSHSGENTWSRKRGAEYLVEMMKETVFV